MRKVIQRNVLYTLYEYLHMVTNLELTPIIKQNSFSKIAIFKKSRFYYRNNAQNEVEKNLIFKNIS